MDAGNFTLTPVQVLEIARYLSEGWSWNALTKLLRRKWAADFTVSVLRRAYEDAMQEKACRKDDRLTPEYCAALWD